MKPKTNRLFSIFKHFAKECMVLFVLILALFSVASGTFVQAADSTDPSATMKSCSDNYSLDSRQGAGGAGSEAGIYILDLLAPARFLPIVPQAKCAANTDGSPVPLPIGVLGIVLVRLFGFICGVIFYLVFATIIISGVMFIWDGIDGQQAAQAKKNLADALLALFLVIGTYVIINTILIVIGANPAVRNGNLGSFFGLP